MSENTSNEREIIYDTDGISAYAKKKLLRAITKLEISVILLAAATLAVVFLGSHLPVFIIGIIIICLTAATCAKLAREIKPQDYGETVGSIVNVHKEIKTVRTTLGGGINLFGPRKYDTYNKEDLRLEVCIEDTDGEVHGYYLRWATEEHEKYYEKGGKSIHIWGTRFPVRLDADEQRWLCPICGEFNEPAEKACKRCGIKAIK